MAWTARGTRAASAAILASVVCGSATALLLLAWLERRRQRRPQGGSGRFATRRLLGEEVEEPEELQCTICARIFRDPVVTSRGFTYERAALLEYWRSAGCANGPRDPQSGNQMVEDHLVPNWQIRHLVERFLREHPCYTPKGWPDAALPPPAQEALRREAHRPLPSGFRVGDVVVCMADRILPDGVVLQKGEVGRILGWATGELRIRCSFLSLEGAVVVDAEEISKQTLPGGFKVGDIVISLIDHQSVFAEVRRGEVGRVVAQASVDVEVRLKVDFRTLEGLDIHFEQVCPETLPGGYSLDAAVVSLINYAAVDPVSGSELTVAEGEQGSVVGQATVERRIRLKVDFHRVKGLDILPSQIAPLHLPGGHHPGDLVVSLIDYDSAGARLRRGDVGTVVGRAHRDPMRRLRVDFPDMKDLEILPMQVQRADPDARSLEVAPL